MNQCEQLPVTPDEELNALFQQVMQMGEAVDHEFSIAIEALGNGDVSIACRDRQDASRLRFMETEIQGMCCRIISGGHLGGAALRMLTGVAKIIPELRRAGDEAEMIARLIHQVAEQNNALMLPRFSYMEIRMAAVSAQDLLRKSLDSFLCLDMNSAAQAEGQGDGGWGNAASTFLVNYMIEIPRAAPAILEMLFVVAAIERIATHARKMSGYVVHMLEEREPANALT